MSIFFKSRGYYVNYPPPPPFLPCTKISAIKGWGELVQQATFLKKNPDSAQKSYVVPSVLQKYDKKSGYKTQGGDQYGDKLSCAKSG